MTNITKNLLWRKKIYENKKRKLNNMQRNQKLYGRKKQG